MSTTNLCRKATAIRKIDVLYYQLSENNWDGYDARPVSSQAAHQAKDLIRKLPDDFAMPIISAEPDGALSLDWMKSHSEIFSVSTGNSSKLSYAWMHNGASGHGVVELQTGIVSEGVFERIKEIMSGATESD